MQSYSLHGVPMVAVALLLLLCIAVEGTVSAGGMEAPLRPSCVKHNNPELRRAARLVARPPVQGSAAQPPSSIDWRNVSGENWLSSSRNQQNPQYCGACWAMATTSSLSDRIRIAKHNAGPDIMLSPQVLLNCVPNGCDGGDMLEAYGWMATHPTPTETCQNYIGIGSGYECSAVHTCMNCNPDGNCSAIAAFPAFSVASFGALNGVEGMEEEVAARGPISCEISGAPLHVWGLGPDRMAVFTVASAGANQTDPTHVVSVVGYGYDAMQGVDYWVIRNSWGEYWGDRGFFRLQRGANALGIESNDCGWAVPTV